MTMRGMQNQTIEPGYAGATINSNTTTVSALTIDTQGFGKVGFALYAGTLTDGEYQLAATETDNADGTTGAAAPANGYITQETLIASNTVKKVEFVPSKRYVRLTIVSTGVTSGCVFKGAVAIKSEPINAPAGSAIP